MELNLDDNETELLQQVLSWAYRDVRMEISDADLPSYRRMLRDREAHLKSILDQVGGLLPLDT